VSASPASPASGVDLASAFRSAASSVWVVTTTAAGAAPALDARPVGFTAISLVSVSLAPALVSFNVSRSSSSLPALVASGRFAAHLLAEDQEPLARRYAASAAGRFPDDGSWEWGPEGLPALLGPVARLTGSVRELVDAGDSRLVLAEVTAAVVAPDRAPLVHHGRDYHRLPGRRAA